MREAKAEIAISEAQLQRDVIDLAHVLGWRVAHFRTARVQRANGSISYQTPVQADGAGWPDLVLCRERRLIFAELKSRRGTLSPEQEAWLGHLRAAGAEVHVWKPRDWTDGHIERILQRIPGEVLAPSPTESISGP